MNRQSKQDADYNQAIDLFLPAKSGQLRVRLTCVSGLNSLLASGRDDAGNPCGFHFDILKGINVNEKDWSAREATGRR